MPVSIGDITEAFEFANTGGNMGEFLAFVCKRTGKIYYQTDFPDAAEMNDELPDDIDDVRYFFSRRGAYPKFKALLARRSTIDHWHAFEARVTEQTLRDWCALHSIEIVG